MGPNACSRAFCYLSFPAESQVGRGESLILQGAWARSDVNLVLAKYPRTSDRKVEGAIIGRRWTAWGLGD
jgi:hypothetical protein